MQIPERFSHLPEEHQDNIAKALRGELAEFTLDLGAVEHDEGTTIYLYDDDTDTWSWCNVFDYLILDEGKLLLVDYVAFECGDTEIDWEYTVDVAAPNFRELCGEFWLRRTNEALEAEERYAQWVIENGKDPLNHFFTCDIDWRSRINRPAFIEWVKEHVARQS